MAGNRIIHLGFQRRRSRVLLTKSPKIERELGREMSGKGGRERWWGWGFIYKSRGGQTTGGDHMRDPVFVDGSYYGELLLDLSLFF